MEWLRKWILGKKPSSMPKAAPTKEDTEKRHLRETLEFTKTQHSSLIKKQQEDITWQKRYGAVQAKELSKLSGIEFEEYLENIFQQKGYEVETTPATGDYGADLILVKNNQRIAVQAKCYTGSVGVGAVQEALAGKAFYHCDDAWVVTTGNYTMNAKQLAKKANVHLLGKTELGQFIIQMQNGS